MTDDGPVVDRRTVLGAVAGAAALAGCGAFERGADGATTPVPADRARDLAERFAPTLYFDAAERWFPTDPRPYERDRDGETVVDGFAALDGYTERFDPEAPPDPAVFYSVVAYEDSPLAVVQYWFYSAFDQFTTNFHWHDWEVLHVYVDTAGAAPDPQLYVASSHSRRVPNNEYLDPDPDRRPTVLAELGSHSSALSVNDAVDEFQRFSVADLAADITNSAIEGVGDVAELPLAYGLPRDEGGRLPFAVPELDGDPLHEHEDLPSVAAGDLLPESHTVRSYDALGSPPTDVPERSTGLVFGPAADAPDEADVGYALEPTADLEHVAEFTGPQLSFEFPVPGPVEDAVASHLTAPGVPWDQTRYENPADDISDPAHRRALADRYDAVGDPAPANTLLARAVEAVPSPDAPDGEGLTTRDSRVEAVALVESEPVAVPTFGGVAAVRDLPAGEHRVTVNGAGLAPHSETVAVGDGGTGTADGTETTAGTDTATDAPTDDGDHAPAGVTLAGAGGEISLVAREDATKLAVDPAESDADLTDLAVEDDFAGRLYDAPLSGPDAVYVHRGGAYTTEVRDSDDAVGAVRVNPGRGGDDDVERVTVDRPETGKASLARYLADVAEETRAEVAAELDRDDDGDSDDDDGDPPGQGNGGGGGGGPGNALRGLVQVLAAIAEAADRAAERAEAGDRGRADAGIEAVADRLERATDRLEAARSDLPPGLANAAENRFDQIDRRSRQARDSEKL
ncbi:hypothetical protein [Halosimplex halophilum]|uniref:hypothetical protein n=1 Tax=Halosimplex halophilum TaxID=2559572 RepID=UPI00107F0305|nr:hypothetical protein [Halosimplex halophilum]